MVYLASIEFFVIMALALYAWSQREDSARCVGDLMKERAGLLERLKDLEQEPKPAIPPATAHRLGRANPNLWMRFLEAKDPASLEVVGGGRQDGKDSAAKR